MKRVLIAGVLAAVGLQLAPNPAAARSDAAKLHLLIALERLAAAPAATDAPVFTRTASISVTGRIQLVSSEVTGPLSCSLLIFYSDSNTSQFHLEEETNRVAVSGRIGTCRITVPFKWQNVTGADNVTLLLEIGNVAGEFARAQLGQPVARASQFFGPSLPLALEGEDVHFTFDTRI